MQISNNTVTFRSNLTQEQYDQMESYMRLAGTSLSQQIQESMDSIVPPEVRRDWSPVEINDPKSPPPLSIDLDPELVAAADVAEALEEQPERKRPEMSRTRTSP